jgi:3-oxoacyl-[acyl-carrier protein] reductase
VNGSLAGQWALVTGASKGIGHCIAETLFGDGANVVLVARNVGDLDDARRRLEASAGPDQQVLVRPADVADRVSIGELFAWVRAELPGLNVLVANAGTGSLVPFLDLSLDTWDQTVALNLTGAFLCMQEAARIMASMPAESNRAIVVVSSIRGSGVRAGTGVYAATKAGVNHLARVAAWELAPMGIRVNTLSPGITVTPLVAENLKSNPDLLAQRTADVPMGRPGQPEDMAAAALYLCQPASRFVTGVDLTVDGGEHLR